MLQLSLRSIMNIKPSPSFACSHICGQKRLFTRRKIQLISEMFYFIWKASFLWEHNNDLLIYKVLYFEGSQNAFFTIVMPCVSNLSSTLLQLTKCPQRRFEPLSVCVTSVAFGVTQEPGMDFKFPFIKWLVGLFNY